jgi:signal transduction histidine kinase
VLVPLDRAHCARRPRCSTIRGLKAVAATVEVTSSVPRILGRAHLLEQVIVNLALNAVDAT